MSSLSVEVQEILCLIQGNDGEYLAFTKTPSQKFSSESYQYLELIEKCLQLPTNNHHHHTSLSLHSRRLLERNEIFLLKRLAIVGCLYRWLQRKCDQLLNTTNRSGHEDDDNYDVENKIQRTNHSNIKKLIMQQFIIGVRQELVDFYRFVTEELYGSYGCKSAVVFDGRIEGNNSDNNLTLLKLNVLLDRIRRKFLCLHHYLLRIIEMTTINFVGDERVKPNDYYLHELFNFTFNNTTADPLLAKTMEKLSAMTIQPIWISLKRWLVQQNVHNDIFLMNPLFFNQSTNSLIWKNWPRFLNPDLLKLISRFGSLMAIFKQVIVDQQQLQTAQMNLISIFDQFKLEKMNWKNQHIKMKLLTSELQCAYVELNQEIVTVLNSGKTFEETFFKIKSFYMEIFWLNNDTSTLQQMPATPKLSAFKPSLPISLDDQIIVLLGKENQRIYQEIFHKFSILRSASKPWFNYWKQVIIFGKSMANKWEFNIKLIVNRQSYIIYQIIQVLIDQQKQISNFISNEWSDFERHFSGGKKHIDVIEFQKSHMKMLKRINIRLESQLQDDNYLKITGQVENFRHKLEEFENITKKTYRIEQGKWHEEKLQIRQEYNDYLRENVLKFFDLTKQLK
ncbi:hypothetical protein HUG17_7014 [Dermatophagoides farinae]|uniref:Uncharacterized protein n=1 Tax=Dermatophagoides farinae TaxID=6954 RepID=A0A9D4NQ33_DERFA|nr:hypothetical protein HUG17_7014 [Dermatophagoides farinae]